LHTLNAVAETKPLTETLPKTITTQGDPKN